MQNGSHGDPSLLFRKGRVHAPGFLLAEKCAGNFLGVSFPFFRNGFSAAFVAERSLEFYAAA